MGRSRSHGATGETGDDRLTKKRGEHGGDYTAQDYLNDKLYRLRTGNGSAVKPDALRCDPVRLPLPCPCCGGDVTNATVEMVLQHVQVLPDTREARILELLWKSKGLAVPTARIFDVMFADDPGGGPGNNNALYNSLKFTLLRLRRKLEGSGVSILSAGYGRGYRLAMERK